MKKIEFIKINIGVKYFMAKYYKKIFLSLHVFNFFILTKYFEFISSLDYYFFMPNKTYFYEKIKFNKIIFIIKIIFVTKN